MVFLSPIILLKVWQFLNRISNGESRILVYFTLVHTSIFIAPCSGLASDWNWCIHPYEKYQTKPSSLTSFRQFALLPLLIVTTHICCIKRADLLGLRLKSGRPASVAKWLLNLQKMCLAHKKESLQPSTKNVHITTGELLSFPIGLNPLNPASSSWHFNVSVW